MLVKTLMLTIVQKAQLLQMDNATSTATELYKKQLWIDLQQVNYLQLSRSLKVIRKGTTPIIYHFLLVVPGNESSLELSFPGTGNFRSLDLSFRGTFVSPTILQGIGYERRQL